MDSLICNGCHLPGLASMSPTNDKRQEKMSECHQSRHRTRVVRGSSSITSSGVSSCSSPEGNRCMLQISQDRCHVGTKQCGGSRPEMTSASRATGGGLSPGFKSPSIPVAKRRMKLIFNERNDGEQSFLRDAYAAILDWIDPSCRWVDFKRNPPLPLEQPCSGQSEASVLMPSLCLTLLLQEREILGCDRLKMANSHLTRPPWRFHHMELVGAHRITAYPYNNQDYFSLAEDLPLCSVRQVHSGEEFLRVTRYVTQRNWLDTINVYRLILNQNPEYQKCDFCAFIIARTPRYSVQFALKKLPKGVATENSERALLVFRVADIGGLVPLLPAKCRQLTDGSWLTNDLDGNRILLELASVSRRPRRSRRPSSRQSTSSIASVIMDTASEFLMEEVGTFSPVFGSPPRDGEYHSRDLSMDMELILRDLEQDAAANDSSGTSTLRTDDGRHGNQRVSRDLDEGRRSRSVGSSKHRQVYHDAAPDPHYRSRSVVGVKQSISRSQESGVVHQHTDSGFGEEKSDGDTGGGGHSPPSASGANAPIKGGQVIGKKVKDRRGATSSPWGRGRASRQSCVQGPPRPYPQASSQAESGVLHARLSSSVPHAVPTLNANQETEAPSATSTQKDKSKKNPIASKVHVQGHSCGNDQGSQFHVKGHCQPTNQCQSINSDQDIGEGRVKGHGIDQGQVTGKGQGGGQVLGKGQDRNQVIEKRQAGGQGIGKAQGIGQNQRIGKGQGQGHGTGKLDVDGIIYESEYEEMAIDCPGEKTTPKSNIVTQKSTKASRKDYRAAPNTSGSHRERLHKNDKGSTCSTTTTHAKVTTPGTNNPAMASTADYHSDTKSGGNAASDNSARHSTQPTGFWI